MLSIVVSRMLLEKVEVVDPDRAVTLGLDSSLSPSANMLKLLFALKTAQAIAICFFKLDFVIKYTFH